MVKAVRVDNRTCTRLALLPGQGLSWEGEALGLGVRPATLATAPTIARPACTIGCSIIRMVAGQLHASPDIHELDQEGVWSTNVLGERESSSNSRQQRACVWALMGALSLRSACNTRVGSAVAHAVQLCMPDSTA